ncbi:MAG: tetratricopeptide repeat protein [Ktedonobacteraceae bacterium]|nr:tetratricopeptide repeat protein [Ktedonobacteraceae bacterium]
MPGDRQAFSAAINAADRYHWDSQWQEAATEYQRALAEFPDDVAARSGLGFCYVQTKQWQQALNEYEYALKRDPDNVIALSKTAELYGILNRRLDAYQAYLHLAGLYSQAGQGARAEATWQKAVQLSPGNPEPHERLARYYFQKKDITMMIQERLQAAQGYLLRNDSGQARVQCEEVLRVDANNVQAQQLLERIVGGQLPLQPGAGAVFPTQDSTVGDVASTAGSGSQAFTGSPATEADVAGNRSGGNISVMGNMGTAGNSNGVPEQSLAAGVSNGMNSASHKKITASQVNGMLKQAQMFQAQGRFDDAVDLCEQILENGFDRPDARYFLGWLYQEQQRWDEAIRQFQMLLNDSDYALSCYYALGQCYRACGDLRTATTHFDEAVDRVNLDALSSEESEQLVQLCQEAAEAHRMLGEQEQTLTIYKALLGFLRSRGWNDKLAQVEFLLQQAQNAPIPPRPAMPAANAAQLPPEQMPSQPVTPRQQSQPAQQPSLPEVPTMAYNAVGQQSLSPQSPPESAPPQAMSTGELPDWLTGILSDVDKTAAADQLSQHFNKPAQPSQNSIQSLIPPEQSKPEPHRVDADASIATNAPVESKAPPSAISWLVEDAASTPSRPLDMSTSAGELPLSVSPTTPTQPVTSTLQEWTMMPIAPIASGSRAASSSSAMEDLLSQMVDTHKSGELKQVAETALASSVASLPEDVRMQVMRSMQDIQKYINHGLLTSATEECLRVIDMAPQYLDVHQVLCEIYVRQGNVEQAVTKYAILVDTYIVNGRINDAIAAYRRILQLEPNNLAYRMRLINLLAAHGNKEDLLRERSLAAESYLRLGYMDRALTELEQALQESPTSVPTRLNYALALHKLGRAQQAVAEYQRVLQIDPRNVIALVRWYILMVTSSGANRANSLEVLSRIRWQLRGEGLKNYDSVVREYQQATEIHPNNADLQFALGQVHQQAGHFDKALDAYNLALRDSAVEVLALSSMAQCLLLQGKPEAAIHHLEYALQLVRRSPKSIDPAVWAACPREQGEEHQAPEVEISMALAKAYGRTGRQEQMQAMLRQIKQTRPVQDEVSSTIAEISARQDDLDGALQEYMDLARNFVSSRQGDNALSVLNEMVRIAPQDARAHCELADIYVNRGLLEEGIAELRILADIYLRDNRREEASDVIQRIGNIYAEMGNSEEALINLRRAVELNPDSIELLREVVGFCLQLGRGQDAIQYQSIIARRYYETLQVKESVAALQQLITIDRGNHEAYDMLGQTYQAVGEYEQASRVYRNLAKVSPGNSLARERLATLKELRSK